MSALHAGMVVRYDRPSLGDWCEYLRGLPVRVATARGLMFTHDGCAGMHNADHAQVIETPVDQGPPTAELSGDDLRIRLVCSLPVVALLDEMADLGVNARQVEAAAVALHDLVWAPRAESLPPNSAARLKQWETRTEAERDKYRTDACTILAAAMAGAS